MISIITATFNQREDFERFYRSICKNTLNEFELVVVDNNSKDGTRDVLRTIEITDPRVRVKWMNDNYGEGTAVRIGMQMANGEILKCDPDIEVPYGWDESFFSYYNQFPEGVRAKIGTISARQQFVLGWKSKEIEIEGFALTAYETILGACFYIPRQTIEICGYWEDFLFYGINESVFATKLQLMGLYSILHPDLVIKHYQSFANQKPRDLQVLYSIQSEAFRAYREFWKSRGRSFIGGLLEGDKDANRHR